MFATRSDQQSASHTASDLGPVLNYHIGAKVNISGRTRDRGATALKVCVCVCGGGGGGEGEGLLTS